MRKKAFVVIVAVIAGLAIIAVGAASFGGGLGGGDITIESRQKASDAITTAVPFDNDNVLYVSQNLVFTLRNIKTNQSKLLSDNLGVDGLKNVHTLSVSKDKKYILFRDELATTDSQLSTILQNEQLQPELGYWWVYDIANKTFRPIPQQDTLQAKIDGDRVIVLASASSFATVTTYDLATLKKETTINMPPTTDIFSVPDGFLLQYDGNVYLTKDGTINKEVLSSVTIIGLTTDKQYAIGLENNKDSSNLVLIHTTDWSLEGIASDVAAGVAWNDSGIAMYYVNNGNDTKPDNKLYAFNVNTKKVSAWSLGKAAQKDDYVPQTVFNDNTALVSDASGAYYLLGNDLKNYPVN